MEALARLVMEIVMEAEMLLPFFLLGCALVLGIAERVRLAASA